MSEKLLAPSDQLLIPTEQLIETYGVPEGAHEAFNFANRVFNEEFRLSGAPTITHMGEAIVIAKYLGYGNVEDYYPELFVEAKEVSYRDAEAVIAAIARIISGHDIVERKDIGDKRELIQREGGYTEYEMDGLYVLKHEKGTTYSSYAELIIASSNVLVVPAKKGDVHSNHGVSPFSDAVMAENIGKEKKQNVKWPNLIQKTENAQPSPKGRLITLHNKVIPDLQDTRDEISNYPNVIDARDRFRAGKIQRDNTEPGSEVA